MFWKKLFFPDKLRKNISYLNRLVRSCRCFAVIRIVCEGYTNFPDGIKSIFYMQ